MSVTSYSSRDASHPAPVPSTLSLTRGSLVLRRNNIASSSGFRWRKLLETDDHGTIDEIAEVENINPSYVSRVLRMTLLAPQIVEAILAGRQPERLTMARAMQPFPVGWPDQRKTLST